MERAIQNNDEIKLIERCTWVNRFSLKYTSRWQEEK